MYCLIFLATLGSYPDATSSDMSWNAGYCCGESFKNDVDDIGFLMALIEEVKSNVKIDPRRVYATGYSNGGAMAQTFAFKAADQIAAVSTNAKPLYDYYKSSLVEESGSIARPIPVLSIHGYNDQVECWAHCLFAGVIAWWYSQERHINGKMGWQNWAEINECVGDPVTLLDNSNDCNDYVWDKAYVNCRDGVEVRQIYSSRNHGGEWLGKNGFDNQFDYGERMLEFLFRWTIPTSVAVSEPAWWSQ